MNVLGEDGNQNPAANTEDQQHANHEHRHAILGPRKEISNFVARLAECLAHHALPHRFPA